MNAADVPPPFLDRVAIVESSDNPAAHAKGSSAAGLYQFTTGTWADLMRRHPELRLTVDGRLTREQSTLAMRQFTAENVAYLETGLGRRVTFSEMYLAHFAGRVGALKVLRADPSCPVRAALGDQACAANPPLAGMNCGELRSWARRKVPDALPVQVVTAGKRGKTAEELNAAEVAKIRRDLGVPE